MSASGKRRVEWSRLGLKELYDSFEELAAKDLAAAVVLRERLAAAANLLEQHPLLGRKGQKPGTRELVVSGTPYTLIYRVTSRSSEWVESYTSGAGIPRRCTLPLNRRNRDESLRIRL